MLSTVVPFYRQANAQELGVNIVNQTERELVGLYISPGDRLGFGFNQLSGQAVLPGEAIVFEPSDEVCIYDILTVFDDGESVSDYNIDLCSVIGGKYTLFDPDGDLGRLVVYNGIDSELREVVIEGATAAQSSAAGDAETAAPDMPNAVVPEDQATPLDPAAICDNFRDPMLRSQCLDFVAEAEAGGYIDEIVVNSRRSRTEASTDCVNDQCDSRFVREVELLGDYAIAAQTEAWILTNRADLSCDTIQRYTVTATFANGRREIQPDVNLCGQGTLVFGQPRQGTPVSVTVVNATDQSPDKPNLTLREIYLAPADGDIWGYNRLDAEVIKAGEVGQITFIDTTDNCVYDVRAVFVNDKRVEHLDPVNWFGVNLCDLEADALVYGLPAYGLPASNQPLADQVLSQSLAPIHPRSLKQLVRPKAQVCLASSGSSVCQPARRRDSAPRRSWWQVWRSPQ